MPRPFHPDETKLPTFKRLGCNRRQQSGMDCRTVQILSLCWSPDPAKALFACIAPHASRFKAVALATVLLATGGCEWVKLETPARQIHVQRLGQDVSACQRLGEIAVSVRDRVGPYERNTLRVKDELETLARNEAVTLHADTVQPLSGPDDGQQRWVALNCRPAGR